jgi:hypothetical protein
MGRDKPPKKKKKKKKWKLLTVKIKKRRSFLSMTPYKIINLIDERNTEQ